MSLHTDLQLGRSIFATVEIFMMLIKTESFYHSSLLMCANVLHSSSSHLIMYTFKDYQP